MVVAVNLQKNINYSSWYFMSVEMTFILLLNEKNKSKADQEERNLI